LLWLLYLPACLLSILLNAGTLWATRKNPNKPPGSVGMTLLPSTPLAVFYTLLSVSLLAATAACCLPEGARILSNGTTLLSPSGPVTHLLVRTCVPGLFLAAMTCLNLKVSPGRVCCVFEADAGYPGDGLVDLCLLKKC